MIRGLLILSVLVLFLESHATHIKGGNIEYVQISPNTFEFTFTGYRDVNGVLFGNGVFDFGDNTSIGSSNDDFIDWAPPLSVDEGIELWKFTVRHTYAGSGRYVVSYLEDFRNQNIQNIEGSISTSFYVEAIITIDPLLGSNSSPKFHVPDFFGTTQTPYITSFNTVDPDGDSLSYQLVSPKQSFYQLVGDYRLPNNMQFYDQRPGRFDFSSYSGNLIWETNGLNNIPDAQAREFSLAVKVSQWRNGFLIGSNIIDYNISIINFETSLIDGFYGLTFPDSECIGIGTSVNTNFFEFEIPNNSRLSVFFDATDSSPFLINGLTILDWNQQMVNEQIEDNETTIEVQFDPNISEEDVRFNMLRVSTQFEFNQNPYSFNTSQSRTFFYSDRCDDLILGFKSSNKFEVEFDRNGILSSQDRKFQKVVISDLFGRIQHESSTINDNYIEFKFQRNTIYLVTLVSNNEIVNYKIFFE